MNVTTLGLQQHITQGTAAAGEVQAVAKYLAELMEGIHGRSWKVMIDHQVRCILIHQADPVDCVESGDN